MTTRRRRALIGRTLRAAVALACALAAGCSHPAAPAERPDLVLVVIDTLREDHLGCYGYSRPTSPHIDALGATGVVFDDNLAQSSWTLPSMASMLTGRHLFVNAQRLPDGAPSLAERLQAAGYETIAFVGNPALTEPDSSYGRGFSTYIGREATGNVTWTAQDLRATASTWLAAHPRTDKPRFVWLHFLDPHYPYEPKGGRTLPGEVTMREDTVTAWVNAVQAAPAGSPLKSQFTEDRTYINAQVDAYDGEIANVDEALGALLAELGSRPRLTVIAADHGEMLWDHQHHPYVVENVEKIPPEKRSLREVFFRDHSYHLFQELVHTPLIVAGVGFAPGAHAAAPTENADIAPTFLRAAGLPDDPALDGRALQDVLAGAARARPFLFSFCNEATGVRTDDRWKLIFPTATGDSYGMPMQLYDLETDPHERHNLAQDPQDTDLFRNLLKVREDAAAAFHLFDDQPIQPDDPGHMQRLEELGYVGAKHAAAKPPQASAPQQPAAVVNAPAAPAASAASGGSPPAPAPHAPEAAGAAHAVPAESVQRVRDYLAGLEPKVARGMKLEALVAVLGQPPASSRLETDIPAPGPGATARRPRTLREWNLDPLVFTADEPRGTPPVEPFLLGFFDDKGQLDLWQAGYRVLGVTTLLLPAPGP